MDPLLCIDKHTLYDDLTLCFSISATISAILCWHLSSASSLFLTASAAVTLSFCTCNKFSMLFSKFQLWQSTNVVNSIMLCLNDLILKLFCKGWLGLKLPLEFQIVFLVQSPKFLGLLLKTIDLNTKTTIYIIHGYTSILPMVYTINIKIWKRTKTYPYLIFKLTEFCSLFRYLFLKHFILKMHKWNVSWINKIPILCVSTISKSSHTSFLYSSWALSLISKFFLTLQS